MMCIPKKKKCMTELLSKESYDRIICDDELISTYPFSQM